jgi:Immunoglobulin domain/Immunoglobulin I-set domain
VISPILFSKKIQVTINRNSSVIHEGVDSIEIECLITGLFTKVFWQFNDTPLSRETAQFENKLVKEKANRNDTGRYTCVAQNAQESASASVDVIVYYSPEFLDSTETNLTVYSGSSVTLNCEVDAKPQPYISWFHIGPKQFDVEDYSNFTVVFDKVNFTQDGLYECIVSNGIQPLITRIFYLTVVAEKEPQLEGVQTVLTEKGQNATLTCQCEGCKPIRELYWTSPSEEILKNSTFFQIYDDRREDKDTLTSSLFIPSLRQSDSGVYECRVKNDKGTRLLQINLQVEEGQTTDDSTTVSTTETSTTVTTSRTLIDPPEAVESSLWWVFLIIAVVACGVVSIGIKICISFRSKI